MTGEGAATLASYAIGALIAAAGLSLGLGMPWWLAAIVAIGVFALIGLWLTRDGANE